VQTHDVTLTTADGPMRAYEAVPDPARGAVVVIPEAFGVNAHIEDVTRRVAAAGYRGLALDVFHRSGVGTAEYGDWDAVIRLFAGLDGDAQILTDLDAALVHLHEAGVANERVGVVGFCFGGRASFLAALERPIGAAVGFYGGGIVTKGALGPFPPLVDGAPGLQVPWLGIFGDEDASIPVGDVERLRAALAEAPAPTEIVRYPAAGHGFHCDVRDVYRSDDAADAWGRAIAWFDHHLP
jgi:carboxymethylenebutenolidase